MAEGKKITDIVPPKDVKEEPSGISSDNKDEIKATANVISKHSSSASIGDDTNNPTKTVSTNAETQGSDEPKKPISKNGINIKPLSETEPEKSPEPANEITPEEPAKSEDTDEPKDADKKEVSDYVSQPPEVGSDTETNEPEETAKSSSPYEASDSLPNENDKKTTEATDAMQNPKIYDTKEYFVPIKNSVHSHGHLGTVIAGIVAAAVVMAAVAFAAMNFF